MSIPPISGPPPSYGPQEENTPKAGMTRQEFNDTANNLVNDAAYSSSSASTKGKESNDSTQNTNSKPTAKDAWDYETKQAAKDFDQSVKENRQQMKEANEKAKEAEEGG